MIVLEFHSRSRIDEIVCRLANARHPVSALTALGLSPIKVDEVLFFLGRGSNPTELLDAPFNENPAYRPSPTRFSDGSWRVFYASLDWNTARAEVGYHVKKATEGIDSPIYYQRLECSVGG